jgi:hypothetical protein
MPINDSANIVPSEISQNENLIIRMRFLKMRKFPAYGDAKKGLLGNQKKKGY